MIAGFSVDRTLIFRRDHDLVKETLSYTVSSTCDGAIVPVITVSSHQPETTERRRDIHWIIVDALHILLRAEDERIARIDHKRVILPDRIHTITATVTNSAGVEHK